MTVLMIGPSLSSRGGIVSVIKNLSEGMNKCGITCSHLDVGFDSKPLKKALRYLLSIPRFLIFTIVLNVDIVHAHPSERWGFYRYVPYVFLCRLFKIPILFHMHGGSFRQFYDEASLLGKRLILRTLRKIDAMVCLSDYWKIYFDELTPVHKYTIPNSVKIYKQNNYNVRADGIVFVGFIEKKKGIFDLLQAYATLEDNFGCILRVCGAGDMELLNSYIRELGLKDRVVIHGWVSEEERIEIFRHSKLFVLPSYFEALPMSLLEAMSFGLPVIVTNVGSMPEVVSDGVNGQIVVPGDVYRLSNALISMLSDKQRLLSISENNYRKIHSSYSIEASVKAMVDIYSEIIQKKRRNNS